MFNCSLFNLLAIQFCFWSLYAITRKDFHYPCPFIISDCFCEHRFISFFRFFISSLKFLTVTAESYFIPFSFSPPCFQNSFFKKNLEIFEQSFRRLFIFLFAIPLKKKNTICSALIIISLRICYSSIVRKFNTSS